MSFWDNMKKMAQPYAEDDYDDYDDEEYEEEEDYEPAERPSRRASRRASAPEPAPMMDEDLDEEDEPTRTNFSFTGLSSEPKSAPAPSSTGFMGQVIGGSSSNKQEVVLFRPNAFNDSSKAADDMRNRKAVIVNLENVDMEMARRVIDFMSGCVYALDGNVKKIAQSAYLFCPHNMDIVGDLETLQAEAEDCI